MQEFIISETTKIFSKAIHKFGQKDNVSPENVSIILYLKGEGEDREVGYKICHDFIPVKEVTIMDVLGVKFDFKGYSLLVPPQIKKIIENFELDFQSQSIEVCVFLHRQEDDEVIYFLYNSGQLVRGFELQDVLKLEMA
jgi:hypothetical protein